MMHLNNNNNIYRGHVNNITIVKKDISKYIRHIHTVRYINKIKYNIRYIL